MTLSPRHIKQPLLLISQALELMDQGRDAEAQTLLLQCDDAPPPVKVLAQYLLAELHRKHKSSAQAVSHFQEAARLADRAQFDMDLKAAQTMTRVDSDKSYTEHLRLAESPHATDYELKRIASWTKYYKDLSMGHGKGVLETATKWFFFHYNMLQERGFNLRGADTLEIGSSILPAVALLYLCAGARAKSVDKFRGPESVQIMGPIAQMLGYENIFELIYNDKQFAPLTQGVKRYCAKDIVAYGSSGMDSLRFIAPEMEFHYGVDASQIPFPGASFDLISSLATLEHVGDPGGDPNEAVIEIARLLRPGGWAAHQIDLRDHRDFEVNPYDFLRYTREEWDAAEVPQNHRANRWRLSHWRDAFTRAGLEIVDLKTNHNGPYPPLTGEIFESLHPDFKNLGRAECEIVDCFFLLRKPVV